MTAPVPSAASERREPRLYAQRVSPRTARTVWCLTCDAVPDIGPINHLADNPDHQVVEAVGELRVWRVNGDTQ